MAHLLDPVANNKAHSQETPKTGTAVAWRTEDSSIVLGEFLGVLLTPQGDAIAVLTFFVAPQMFAAFGLPAVLPIQGQG